MAEGSAFTVRSMRPDDLDQAFRLSLDEGWNQTMKDWKLLLDNPANICIIAEKDNIVAGTATAIIHGHKIAWIGMVIVGKPLRGQGAGKLLLENIIGRLKNIGSVKLDATPAGEPLYRKLGFQEEYKIFRMTAGDHDYETGPDNSGELFNITVETLPEIVSLDSTVFGAERSYLLNSLLTDYPEKAIYLKRNGRTEGFIFGRKGSRFNYLGPLAALSDDSAMQLISRSLKSLKDSPLALDIPADKEKLIAWLESAGFEKQRHFIRMYLDHNPYPGIPENQYLISGPEFG